MFQTIRWFFHPKCKPRPGQAFGDIDLDPAIKMVVAVGSLRENSFPKSPKYLAPGADGYLPKSSSIFLVRLSLLLRAECSAYGCSLSPTDKRGRPSIGTVNSSHDLSKRE